jgi:hypothetical protein
VIKSQKIDYVLSKELIACDWELIYSKGDFIYKTTKVYE